MLIPKALGSEPQLGDRREHFPVPALGWTLGWALWA